MLVGGLFHCRVEARLRWYVRLLRLGASSLACSTGPTEVPTYGTDDSTLFSKTGVLLYRMHSNHAHS